MSNGNAAKAGGSPTVQADCLRQRLTAPGLSRGRGAGGGTARGGKHDRSGHVAPDRLLAHEMCNRDGRRVRNSVKQSGLPVGMTPGKSDLAFQPSIERRQVETLETCPSSRNTPRSWPRVRRR